jgi:hypothetical protein
MLLMTAEFRKRCISYEVYFLASSLQVVGLCFVSPFIALAGAVIIGA